MFSFALSLYCLLSTGISCGQSTAATPDSTAAALPTDCSGIDLPSNVVWSEVAGHFAACKVYTTRRADVRTLSAFITYLRHKDAGTRPLTEVEARLLRRYYRYLKYCSECETTDCRSCDELVEMNEEAKVLVRGKRFRLE